MATVNVSAALAFTGGINLTEVEMRALDALVGYGDDAFLAVFKEKLRAAYIRDHESGLRSFFAAVRRDVLPALHDVDEARRALGDALREKHEAREHYAQARQGQTTVTSSPIKGGRDA